MRLKILRKIRVDCLCVCVCTMNRRSGSPRAHRHLFYALFISDRKLIHCSITHFHDGSIELNGVLINTKHHIFFLHKHTHSAMIHFIFFVDYFPNVLPKDSIACASTSYFATVSIFFMNKLFCHNLTIHFFLKLYRWLNTGWNTDMAIFNSCHYSMSLKFMDGKNLFILLLTLLFSHPAFLSSVEPAV